MGATAFAEVNTGSQPVNSITYAQARLWLGISSIGFHVLLASFALILAVPQRLFPAFTEGLGSEGGAVVAAFLLLALVQLPFDLFGGFLLPNRFTPTHTSLGAFAARLARGVTIQIAVFATVFVLYQRLGAAYGLTAAVLAFVAVQLILIALQHRVACLVGGFASSSANQPSSAISLESHDSGFTGGVSGLPGWESVVVPAAWSTAWESNVQEAAISRRRLIASSGLRRQGMIGAVLWNTALFSLALVLPGGGCSSVAALATSFLYYSLLSFGGLMLLPMFSRAAVLAADQLSARESGVSLTEQLIARSGDVPEGEPSRSASHESIFHPLPCEQRRLDALTVPRESARGWWNIARMSLYCSWAFGGPLSRGVHCNIGRPQLWVYLPCD